jgi:nitrogen regulatory protein PII
MLSKLGNNLHECVQTVNNRKSGKRMKLITAIIRPFKLDEVREALIEIGVGGITVTEIKGFGAQQGHTELYRGAEYAVDFVPKLEIKVAVSDAVYQDCMDVIIENAGTGRIGDGKIFVTELLESVRIRTQEVGEQSL